MTLEQLVGAALVLVFLADVFLTVLYARAGTGLLAPYWNRAIWALLRAISKMFGNRRGAVLSFAGPLIVVLLIAFWAIGLTIGAALIIRPELGTAIRPSSGDTPTDFAAALLVAGNSLSIVGSGDYSPHTAGTRLLYLLNSLIGASVLSLVLSYLVQVYSALRERNAFALTIDLMTDGTGDAAEMLARLMPGGDSSDATSELGNLVRSLAATTRTLARAGIDAQQNGIDRYADERSRWEPLVSRVAPVFGFHMDEIDRRRSQGDARHR